MILPYHRVNAQHHRAGPWIRGGLGYSSTPFWVKHELQKATDTITSLRVRKEGKDKRPMTRRVQIRVHLQVSAKFTRKMPNRTNQKGKFKGLVATNHSPTSHWWTLSYILQHPHHRGLNFHHREKTSLSHVKDERGPSGKLLCRLCCLGAPHSTCFMDQSISVSMGENQRPPFSS